MTSGVSAERRQVGQTGEREERLAQAFGSLLKEWRGRRRLSQLGLALEADVSARHLAFLETGRARPSRDMVIRLAAALSLPYAERNRMLVGAGFAPAFPALGLEAREMAEVRAAVERLIGGHDPFPALAIDRHWRIVAANAGAVQLFGGLGLGPGESLVEAFRADGPLRRAVANWGVVARHLAARLRAESAHLGGDPVLEAAVRALSGDPDFEAGPETQGAAVVPTLLRLGGRTLALFSMIAQFGTVEDTVVSDLRIELFFPADAATRAALEAAGDPSEGMAGP
jgi:transcriptional regulator with XRE-family HTH domain